MFCNSHNEIEIVHYPTYACLKNGVQFALGEKYKGPRKGNRGLNVPKDYYVQGIFVTIFVSLKTGRVLKRESNLRIRLGASKEVGSGSIHDMFLDFPLTDIKWFCGDRYHHIPVEE